MLAIVKTNTFAVVMFFFRQCRVDDETMAKCAPVGVQLPRSAVMQILSDELDSTATNKLSTYPVDLVASSTSPTAATLVLTLDIGSGLRPMYKFEMASAKLSG